MQWSLLSAVVVWAVPAVAGAAGEPMTRSRPQPLPAHPGNIFLRGDEAIVAPPAGKTKTWRLFDGDERLLAEHDVAEGRLHLGALPVGWYRLRHTGDPATEWLALAVLEPLRAPTPPTSPVACDVAMAWFYPPEKMEAVANLCALAGLNWVRDRLAWGEIEPRRGELAPRRTRYDASAQAQSAAGLRVLQVNHSSPGWANPNHRRFPPDLRDAYRFYRAMAERWRGQVHAFEPWNEADIDVFGGHTGSEIASLQKAACLGLRAGAPEVLVCQNVFATHRAAQLDDFRDNAPWPYFDTFNLHHYAPFDSYPALYADFRAVSAGRPLWVTECALPVKWAGDKQLQEPTDADLQEQAERVAKTFACSLHEASAATFYFLLPHYVEGQTQFGILRRDLTPRPAYVALAAVGRLLADARPAGRLTGQGETLRAFAFRAVPDGQPRLVVIAWTKNDAATLRLPAPPLAVYDHLGRSVAAAGAMVPVTKAPRFILLAPDTPLTLDPPPAAPPVLAGRAPPVVLQVVVPEDRTVLARSAMRISSEKPQRVELWAYNFGDQPVRGKLQTTGPEQWQVHVPATVDLAPQERKQLPLELDCRGVCRRPVETLRIAGDFGAAGSAVLAFRLMPEPFQPAVQSARKLNGANDPARWRPMISGNGRLQLLAQDGGVLADAEPAGPDRWVYPRYELAEQERVPPGATGLGFTFTLLEGAAQCRVIFDEDNGAGYVADLLVTPRRGETLEALALFEGATFGHGWSPPDPNQRLDPAQIRAVKIGVNTKGPKVKFAVKNLRWVHF